MRRMTTTGGTEPERQGGERRLARPPSDRYGAAASADQASDGGGGAPAAAGSFGRAVAFGLLGAAALAVAITVLGGVVLITAGLIAVAALGGWGIAVAVRAGGRETVSPPRRRGVAVALAGGAVLAGQLGLWLFARYEGGVLGPVDYLSETFGLLVPLQFLFAIGAAWLAAR
jgi:hypothetical protein